ncbi:unnamed protein product [Closterium sp. NIES-64]|nr:unnamed protein product [Closterium sp. NIES-64]
MDARDHDRTSSAKLQRSETTIASGAQRLLDEALAEVKSAHPGIQVEAMLGEGDPRDVLCDRAAEDFVDFIIVGSQGKTALTVRQPRLLSSYDAVRCVCVGGCAGVNVRPRGVQSRPNQPVSRPAAAAVVSAAAGATARGKDAMEVGGSGQAQVCAQYSLAEVVQATGEWAESRRIGGGSFGDVYKGECPHNPREEWGKVVWRTYAVFHLVVFLPDLLFEELWQVKEMATKNHPNLVRLVGYCLDFSPVTERMEQIVIYEFMPHGDLEHWIGPSEFSQRRSQQQQQQQQKQQRYRRHHRKAKAHSSSLSRDTIKRDNSGWFAESDTIPSDEAIRYSATATNQRARLAHAALASVTRDPGRDAIASVHAPTGDPASTRVQISESPQEAAKGEISNAAEEESDAEASLAAQDAGKLGRMLRYWGGRMMVEPDVLNVYLVWYGDWSHEQMNIILRQAMDEGRSEHLPQDPSAAYVILTSGDVHLTEFCRGFCAYHTSATIVDGGPKLAYAFVGDSTKQCPQNCTYRYFDEGYTGSNRDLAADSVVDKLAHELTELVTNPFQGEDERAGWVVGGEGTDETSLQQIENADLCEWRYSGVNRDGNGRHWNLQGLNGTRYLIQDNFNVELRRCVQQGEHS